MLALGTGNFGTGCGHGAEPDEAPRVFDGYVEAGGNFIDTVVGSSCRLIYAENP
jgi:aryl-alcohol dehydrogenase-like predicted oxidoreductase